MLNKSDLLPEDEARAKAISIAQALGYRGPAFLISGAAHTGTSELCEAVMRFLETAEAPAQGNLPLPIVAAKKPAVKKPAPKKKAPPRTKAPAKKRAARKSARARKAADPKKKSAAKQRQKRKTRR